MSELVSTDPRIGTELAGYRIEGVLGRGGMGVVYLAEDLTLGRKVALKVLSPELSADVEFRERFRAEWRLAASIDHPHVIPIYEAGDHDGTLFIAMRYVEGIDLKRLIDVEGALEPERAVELMSQVAEGLDAAHDRGLVHRDVKPSNVLIAREREKEHVYLADFGLTKPAATDVEARDSIALSGSHDWVSPEQIVDGTAEPASDVYGLGAVLYAALTAQVPYPRAGPLAVLWAHLEEEPPKPSELDPTLPTALDDVIARAMAKNPEERFASGADLAQAARAALPARRGWRRRVVATVLAGVLVTVAAVVAALVLTGGDEAAVGEQWTRVVHDEAAFRGGSNHIGVWDIVAGGPGLVASGGAGEFPEQEAAVWTSKDGSSWTRVRDRELSAAQNQNMTALAEVEGRLVGVGTVFRDIGGELADFDAAVWTSTDALVWERVIDDSEVFGTADAGSAMMDVSAGGPGVVAVGLDDGEGAVWTSPDGLRWSRAESGAGAFASRFPEGEVWLLGIAAAEDGRLVAVGFDEKSFGSGKGVGAAWLSSDGLSWTRAPNDPSVFGDESTHIEIEDVVATNTGFVAVGTEAKLVSGFGFLGFIDDAFDDDNAGSGLRGAVWSSEDGLVWSRVPDHQLPDTGDTDVRLFAVAVGGPGLVAVGWSREAEDISPVVWTSPDGASWEPAAQLNTTPGSSGRQIMTGAVAGGPGLVAIGGDGSRAGTTAAIWTSP